jgi:predicted nucleic acid-binding protein
MTFLLDTNLVSEWTKPLPNRGVMSWLNDVDEDRVFLSVVSLAELRSGVASLAAGRRREQLDVWLSVELPQRFEGRLLTIDAAIADQWGRVTAMAKAAGRPIHTMDAFLAATALVHDFVVVTRNTSDFEAAKVGVVSPWTDD